MLGVLVVLVAAEGCMPSGAAAMDATDAVPTIMFQPFTSMTWSLSMTGGAAQLSITDGGGTAACALSEDQRRSLGTAGVQIIAHLSGTVTDTCPSGHFPLSKCATALGTDPYAPAGCAFYRQWNAQGTPVGTTAAINGEISFTGDATSCTIIANVGFLGGSFSERFTLMNGAGVQPWCREG
ncbi:MAG TPA: hypothetical protein VHN14_35580 [Kofleriaceae bacterium]|nr:hypothetical protein [Kofleriaceae bacterium]